MSATSRRRPWTSRRPCRRGRAGRHGYGEQGHGRRRPCSLRRHRSNCARLTFVPARSEFAWRPVPTGNYIDEINYRRLKALRLQPSDLATDAQFIRRVYLDAIGLLPTPDEVRSFLAATGPDKRSRLIDALLQRPEFDDFWTLKWWITSSASRSGRSTLKESRSTGTGSGLQWHRTSRSTSSPASS